MKVTIEVDCTPEEARRAIGLPDLTPIHDLYLDKMREAITTGGNAPELLGAMVRNWAPMGEAGVDFWQKLFAAGAKPGS